jgi:hypothetical protein
MHSDSDLPVCWECDSVTDQPVVVVLRGPAAVIGRIVLCSTCFDVHYLSLMSDPEAANVLSIHEEPDPI